MKKILFFFSFVVFFHCGYAQLYPVQNLEWDHWYVIGHNYFILSWDQPQPSTDTLTGYNIYRENDLYMFTAETSIYHTEGGSNVGEDFILYNWGDPFWMHVTAVYNAAGEESVYPDSAYCFGFAIGQAVPDNADKDFKVYPNPSAGSFTIHFPSENSFRLSLFDLSGKAVYQTVVKNKTSLTIRDLPPGSYILEAVDETGRKVRQKVISY